MTRQRKAQVLTVALIAVSLGIVFLRSSSRGVAEIVPAIVSEPPRDSSPQDTIYAMLDAARGGDIPAYLDAYAGPLAVALRQSVREQGEAAFVKYLKETNASIKGIAITEPEPAGEGEVRARVEYVYADRNEVQAFHLRKQPDAKWKITRLQSAERIKTLIPYGTPVK